VEVAKGSLRWLLRTSLCRRRAHVILGWEKHDFDLLVCFILALGSFLSTTCLRTEHLRLTKEVLGFNIGNLQGRVSLSSVNLARLLLDPERARHLMSALVDIKGWHGTSLERFTTHTGLLGLHEPRVVLVQAREVATLARILFIDSR